MSTTPPGSDASFGSPTSSSGAANARASGTLPFLGASFGGDPSDFAGAERNAVGDHATAEDSLGFTPYVDAITAFLTSPATEPPITISIEGEWGSGKSSFMLQLEKQIAGASRRDVFVRELPPALGGYNSAGSFWKALRVARARKPPPVIRFNAWRHDKQDALWAAFALAFAARLRERIGPFRAFYGDVLLFRFRLKGLRGWLEVLLLVLSLSLFFGSTLDLILHVIRVGLPHAVSAFMHLPVGEKAKKLDDLYAELFTRSAATHGSIFGFFLLGLAGFWKFKDQFKLPIATDLKKYLSTPDYEGHAAFIESFHEDFARLLRAYAGDERVFIFIDDLDRCDVPRAAELMQAINLMIADAGRLVFILGMDREKVAAGITQKYKDLLPFLPEYGAGPSLDLSQGVGSSPLSFGYSYLEKFIQLSFTLPVIGGSAALEKFLDAMLTKSPSLPWRRRVAAYWKPVISESRIAQRWRGSTPLDIVTREHPADTTPVAPAQSREETPAVLESLRAEARVHRLRLKIERDSKGVRAIVAMVAPAFDNNPRRLKQFVSTFRLSLSLSSDQNILGLDAAPSGVTPQQLGKFVALTMRFPDLRVELGDDPELLGKLERTAGSWPSEATPRLRYWRWLHRKSIRQILLYGLREITPNAEYDQDASLETEENPYSLKDLDVRHLLSLLPKVAHPAEPEVATLPASAPPSDAPPDSSKPEYAPTSAVESAAASAVATANEFEDMAGQYMRIRSSMSYGDARTRAMTEIVKSIRTRVAEFSPRAAREILLQQQRENEDGNRIVALAIAVERVDPANMPWLISYLNDFRSSFEHYWTIRTLLLHEACITRSYATDIEKTLTDRMSDIAKDSNRFTYAQRLLKLSRSILAAPPTSSANKYPPHRETPLYLIPLPQDLRAAYQNLYNAYEQVIQITIDVALLEALNASQNEVGTVLLKDSEYQLGGNESLFGELSALISQTNNGLAALRSQIAGTSKGAADLSSILTAIDRVMQISSLSRPQ